MHFGLRLPALQSDRRTPSRSTCEVSLRERASPHCSKPKLGDSSLENSEHDTENTPCCWHGHYLGVMMSAVVTMMTMLMMRTMAAVKTIHVIVMVGLDIKAVALLVAGIAGIAWHHFYHCRRLSYSSRPDSDRPTLQNPKSLT